MRHVIQLKIISAGQGHIHKYKGHIHKYKGHIHKYKDLKVQNVFQFKMRS